MITLDFIKKLESATVDQDFISGKMPNLVRVFSLLKNHPTIAVVETEVVDGRVYLRNCSPAIEYITGYTPEELKDQPLERILSYKTDKKSVNDFVGKLKRLGAVVKHNTNKHKDGRLIDTDGLLVDESHNKQLEIVWVREDNQDLR